MPRFLALGIAAVLLAGALASGATAAVRNGLIAYAVGGGEDDWTMRAIRRDGTHDRQVLGPTAYRGGMYRGPSGPQWSSDGKRLLFGAHSHLDNPAFGLEYATASGKRIRTIPLGLTPPVVLRGWAWAPDGRHVVFASGNFQGRSRLYTIALDGSHRKRLPRGEMPTWSSDGRDIVFQRSEASFGNDAKRFGLFVMRPNGHGLRRLTASNEDSAPSISPDGRQVAYVRTVGRISGAYERQEWHIVDISGQHDVVVVTRPLGLDPVPYRYGAPQWTPDGQRLAYVREPTNTPVYPSVAQLLTILPTGADERVEFDFPALPTDYAAYDREFAWQPR